LVVFGVESNVDQVGVSSQISGGNLLHYAELSQYYYDDDISTSSSDLMSDNSSSEYCPTPMKKATSKLCRPWQQSNHLAKVVH